MFHEIYDQRIYDIPLAPLRSGDLVIDIGANHGFASVDFASRGARVVAFEPSPDVFAYLCANVEANGLSDRVEAYCAAVTDRDGEAELFETPEMGGGMSSLESRYVEVTQVPISSRSVVPTRSILNVLRDVGERRVRLLKLDCEGSELKILAALRLEDRLKIDSIALEYHPGVYEMRELVAILENWSEFEISKPGSGDTDNLLLHLVKRKVALETLAG
jgi:FkbM family methyltransferase